MEVPASGVGERRSQRGSGIGDAGDGRGWRSGGRGALGVLLVLVLGGGLVVLLVLFAHYRPSRMLRHLET